MGDAAEGGENLADADAKGEETLVEEIKEGVHRVPLEEMLVAEATRAVETRAEEMMTLMKERLLVQE